MVSLYRNLRGTSWGNPKLDLSSCVFYAALWRPDTAGSTFLSQPTPSASPVSCTVTGAIYGSQGRTFDGIDDLINSGDIAALNGAGALSIVIWAKQSVLDQTDHLFMKGTGGGDTDHLIGVSTSTDGNLYVYFRAGSNSYATLDYSTVVTAGVFFHFTLIFDGSLSGNVNRLKILINNSQQTLSFVGTIPATSGTLTGTNLLLGTALDFLSSWNGIVGEFLLYNRAITVQEDQNIGLATKWRYQ